MALNINGRMKVKTLRADFLDEFGLTLRVYDGRSFADDDATLATIRKGNSKDGEFSPRKNTKVGNLEDKMMELFGIKTQVGGSDDSYLCDNDHTLAKALEIDKELMLKRDKRSDKPKVKPAKASQATMSITDIINELKNTYRDHEDLERMVSDLENESDYHVWADILSTEDFNKNIKLAKFLYEIAVEKAEDFYDFVTLGDYIADSNGFNDKAWARDLYETAFKVAEESSDLLQLGESIINEDYLDDKVWAKELFSLAFEKSNDIYVVRGIASTMSRIDKNWSKKAYQKALDIVSNDEEYKTIAHEVEKFLDDSKWAKEIREMTLKKDSSSLTKTAQQISDEIIDRTNVLCSDDPNAGDSIDRAEGDTMAAYNLYDSMYEEEGATLDELMGSDILSEEQKLEILKTYIEYLEKLTSGKFTDIIE